MRRSARRWASAPARWARCCGAQRRRCSRRFPVKHLDDGALRRLYDDPLVLSDPDREHFRGCEECRTRFVTVAADAREAAQLMEVGAVPATVAADAPGAGFIRPAAGRSNGLRWPRGR